MMRGWKLFFIMTRNMIPDLPYIQRGSAAPILTLHLATFGFCLRSIFSCDYIYVAPLSESYNTCNLLLVSMFVIVYNII